MKWLFSLVVFMFSSFAYAGPYIGVGIGPQSIDVQGDSETLSSGAFLLGYGFTENIGLEYRGTAGSKTEHTYYGDVDVNNYGAALLLQGMYRAAPDFTLYGVLGHTSYTLELCGRLCVSASDSGLSIGAGVRYGAPFMVGADYIRTSLDDGVQVNQFTLYGGYAF